MEDRFRYLSKKIEVQNELVKQELVQGPNRDSENLGNAKNILISCCSCISRL